MSDHVEALFDSLAAAFGDRPRRREPLAEHTMFRLGGPADIWLAVESVAELVTAVGLARQHDVPLFLLGRGANLLIGDEGIRGLVIQNRAGEVAFPPPDASPPLCLVAASGANLPGLVRKCVRRGLSGLEWAIGIPGTVGGAVINNAGAYGRDIACGLAQAELLSPLGERVWQGAEWFEYGYRASRLKWQVRGGGWVVLQAKLCLQSEPAAEIEARLGSYNEQRQASQPTGATIGSMFKNPPGDYAGRLIEAAGLKGYRHNQARISPVHANFFQNLGGATAADMLALVRLARQAVRDKFGIQLELEIEVVDEQFW